MASKSRADIRHGVHSRIRKKVSGTQERPRLAVYRSLNHIYAQVIDDVSGKTLVAASTTEKDLKGATGGNIEAAQKVGRAIAERAISAGVENVVFDRGGYVYHGRVKALLDATREAGLNKNENTSDANTPPSTESVSDKATSAIGNIVGTVADAIGNLLGGSTDAPAKKPAKKTAEDRSQITGDEPEAQTGKESKEDKENNENE